MEKEIGQEVKLERIRRITGYLVGTTGFNDAKRAEEQDRVKHGIDELEPVSNHLRRR